MPSVKEGLVSVETLREKLGAVAQVAEQEAPYLPDYAKKRDERWMAEFERIIREASTEFVGTGRASELTGWDGQTLRKYARAAVEGDPLPAQWQGLIARRDGREFSLVLATIPIHPSRRSTAA